MRTAMMPITTSSSTRVNARRLLLLAACTSTNAKVARFRQEPDRCDARDERRVHRRAGSGVLADGDAIGDEQVVSEQGKTKRFAEPGDQLGVDGRAGGRIVFSDPVEVAQHEQLVSGNLQV